MRNVTMFLAALACVAVIAGAGSAAVAADKAAFEFKDVEGKHLDLLLGGKPLTRYMYEVDTSDKAKTFDTAKVFTHVFNEEGTETITKGSGGKYPHHRGIFLGFSKLSYDGNKRSDWWHVRNVAQRHQKFLKLDAGAEAATSTMLIHWNDGQGKPVVIEERTQIVYKQPKPGLLMMDFISKLKPARSDIELNGDPEHAGMQYRPSQKVAENKSAKYLFPDESITTKNVGKERDMAWAAESYEINGKKYTVQHMNHPDNPKGTRYSAYRDYGRFGAFTTAKVKQGESLTLRYRLWVASGELLDRAAMKARSDTYNKAPKPDAGK